MTVSAQPVNFLARPATGSVSYDGPRLVTPWHHHDRHQLEYALAGVVEVETEAGHHLLPSQQAAWIPAGVAHRSTLADSVRTVSVFFRPDQFAAADRVRILAVSPLLREMIVHAQRWPLGRAEQAEVDAAFYRTMAHLVGEALEHEAPLILPTSAVAEVAAAMAYTRDHLAATVGEVAGAVGLSERTLRRLFASAGIPWRAYQVQARLLRAMVLLGQPDLSILDVATRVGFESPTAFTRAFAARCGETPSSYRRRITASRLGA